MKRTLLLALMSLTLGAVGMYLASRASPLDAAAYRVADPNWAIVAVAALGLVTLWFVPALRMQFLAARHGYRLDTRTAWLTHVVMVFGAALTPSGSGGAPSLVAALGRLGVPWGTAIGVAIQIFVLDLVVFAWLIPLGLVYLIFSQTLSLPRELEIVSLVATALAIGIAVSLRHHPRLVVRLMLSLAHRRLLRRWRTSLRHNARSYYRSARTFAAMRLGGWSWLLFVTLLSWIASFALFWALLSLYGAPVAFADLVAFLSAVTLVSFVVPTPGASGYMELAAGLGAVGRAGAASVAPLVLWRLGSFYVTYALGPVASWLLLTRRGALQRARR